MNGLHYQDGELVEMVDKRQSEYSVASKQPRTTNLLAIVVLFLISITLVVVGISLIVMSSNKSCTNKVNEGKDPSEYCNFSREAKRAGLGEFLSEIQRSFYELHPHRSYHDPKMDTEESEAMIKTYRPYNPSPEILKRITDTSLALLNKLKQLPINVDKLKPREKKVLAQAKHYLQHTFGQPYDMNYYAGDWMLGPNQFCWQPICGMGGDIFYHLDYFKPAGLGDLENLR